MLKSLTTAATGMIAQQNNLDVIANNVANVNTTGFKHSRAEFQDLLSQAIKTPGAMMNQGTFQPVGLEIGLGVKTVATTRVFTQGVTMSTGRNLDVEIEGDGFFQIMQQDGTLSYTRDGCFQLDSLGQLTTNDGLIVQPAISIPRDATEITITQDGNVSVTLPGQTQQSVVGTIQLVKFQNPSGLLSIGHNLYVETQASGVPIQDTPGQNGLGKLQQGMLEGSNVQIVDELIGLIKAERAFESNSKIVNTSNNILQETNNLIR